MIDNINNSKTFYKEVEEIANESNGSHFDAILEYVRRNDIEIETAASYVKRSQVLKAKIEEECGGLNLLVNTTNVIETTKDEDETF